MKNQKDINEKVFDIVLEESFDKYAEHIAKNEPEYQLTPEDEKIIENSKQRIFDAVVGGKTPKKISVKKILVLAAVIVVIMAIALAATTSAFRMFLYETYSELTGTKLNIDTKKTVSETYDIVNFKYKDKVLVPHWLPENMKLIKYTDEEEKLIFKYETNDFWLTIKEKIVTNNFAENIQTEDNIYKTYAIKTKSSDITVVEMISENDTITYTAYWYENNMYYSVRTNVDKVEFENILHHLYPIEE